MENLVDPTNSKLQADADQVDGKVSQEELHPDPEQLALAAKLAQAASNRQKAQDDDEGDKQRKMTIRTEDCFDSDSEDPNISGMGEAVEPDVFKRQKTVVTVAAGQCEEISAEAENGDTEANNKKQVVHDLEVNIEETQETNLNQDGHTSQADCRVKENISPGDNHVDLIPVKAVEKNQTATVSKEPYQRKITAQSEWMMEDDSINNCIESLTNLPPNPDQDCRLVVSEADTGRGDEQERAQGQFDSPTAGGVKESSFMAEMPVQVNTSLDNYSQLLAEGEKVWGEVSSIGTEGRDVQEMLTVNILPVDDSKTDQVDNDEGMLIEGIDSVHDGQPNGVKSDIQAEKSRGEQENKDECPDQKFEIGESVIVEKTLESVAIQPEITDKVANEENFRLERPDQEPIESPPNPDLPPKDIPVNSASCHHQPITVKSSIDSLSINDEDNMPLDSRHLPAIVNADILMVDGNDGQSKDGQSDIVGGKTVVKKLDLGSSVKKKKATEQKIVPKSKIVSSHVWSEGKQSDRSIASPVAKKPIKKPLEVKSTVYKSNESVSKSTKSPAIITKKPPTIGSRSSSRQQPVKNTPVVKKQDLKPFYAGSRQNSMDKSIEVKSKLKNTIENKNDNEIDLKKTKIKNKVLTLSKAYEKPAKTIPKRSASNSMNKDPSVSKTKNPKPENLKIMVVAKEIPSDDESRRIKKITNTVKYVKLGTSDENVKTPRKTYISKPTASKKEPVKYISYSKPIAKAEEDTPQSSDNKPFSKKGASSIITQVDPTSKSQLIADRRERAAKKLSTLQNPSTMRDSHHLPNPSPSKPALSQATTAPYSARPHPSPQPSPGQRQSSVNRSQLASSTIKQSVMPAALSHGTGVVKFNKLMAGLNARLIDDLKLELND